MMTEACCFGGRRNMPVRYRDKAKYIARPARPERETFAESEGATQYGLDGPEGPL